MTRKKKVYRDGKVHVMSRMCDTCIFRPGNIMHLGPGRVKEMVEAATQAGSTIICHDTSGKEEAACRGFFERYSTQPLQVAARLGFIEYVSPENI